MVLCLGGYYKVLPFENQFGVGYVGSSSIVVCVGNEEGGCNVQIFFNNVESTYLVLSHNRD